VSTGYTDTVVLTGEDIDIDAVDVDVDASGFSKILNTDDVNVQLALAELDQHTHTEADIVDLDKYTQGETNALLDGKVDVGSLAASLTLYPTTANSDITNYVRMVDSISDPDYNTAGVNIPTGSNHYTRSIN
jgi:hypothetical protein